MSIGGEEAKHPGSFIFALLFLAASLLLLSQLGAETKFSAKGDIAAQPAFWPAIGVIGMVVFGTLHMLSNFRQRSLDLSEISVWLRSFEYLVWFMIYVFAVPMIGYLPATLIFTVSLAFRAGYRSRRMLGAAAAIGLIVVLIFKTFLSVKIPAGALYEYLPDGLRSAVFIYF